MSNDPEPTASAAKEPRQTFNQQFQNAFGRFSLELVCAGWIALIWLWDPAILTLTVDDSFYYLKTALNIASGDGVTFDRINATNGFHPLWMSALIPLAWTFAGASALLVKAVLTVQVALVYGGTFGLSRVGVSGGRYVRTIAKFSDRFTEPGWRIPERRLNDSALSEVRGFPRTATIQSDIILGNCYKCVFAVLLLNFYFAKAFINGQESALQYFLICFSLVYSWKRSVDRGNESTQSAAALGLLAGLTTLARLEAMVFAWVLLWLPLMWPRKRSEAFSLNARLKNFLVAAGTLSAVVVPYVAWNLYSQGHLMPVSAAIKYGEPSKRDALGNPARLRRGRPALCCGVPVSGGSMQFSAPGRI